MPRLTEQEQWEIIRFLQVDRPMTYVRSKKRVADHGEVFTPPWMVASMLDLVKDETARIDSGVLAPTAPR